jgi:maleate isomerase
VPDLLAWRKKFGVVTPSTNTIVQPEYDDMRPPGVTNHISRMHIPDEPHVSDADMNETVKRIDAALEAALERVMTCRPDALVLGISGESIWGGGTAQSRNIAQRVRKIAGDLPLAQAADAIPAALKALGIKKRIGVISPYYSSGQGYLKMFWDEIGYEAVRTVNLNAKSPVLIAHATREELNAALREVDGKDIEAIVQFGANLPFGRIAAEAEGFLGKPVIAVNTATYWHALRTNGIQDRKYGYGRLLWEA